MARILIVEDDPDLAEALKILLRSSGHDAHAIHDGRRALTEAARLEPEVVISDIGLPSIDGAAVAHALRSRYGSALRLVALTASPWPDAIIAAIIAFLFFRSALRVVRDAWPQYRGAAPVAAE